MFLLRSYESVHRKVVIELDPVTAHPMDMSVFLLLHILLSFWYSRLEFLCDIFPLGVHWWVLINFNGCIMMLVPLYLGFKLIIIIHSSYWC